MNFLPIVRRELRLASRRKGTYRMRTLTALLAIVLSMLFLFVFALAQNAQAGRSLFETLSYSLFGLCALSGIFLTADCLSEEKREGTLGLLFLTDLKGYDVVTGKFMAASLNAFYGLVAVFPVMALPLIMGGVTGSEFWRMVLALVNMMFFSLSLGIYVSAKCRDSQKAIGNTLAFLIVFTAFLPFLDFAISGVRLPVILWRTALVSPFYPFWAAFENVYLTSGNLFWKSLVISHVVAWFFYLLSCHTVLHSWQDKPFQASLIKRFWNWNVSGRARNARTREALLEQNPISWLMSGGHHLRWTIWGLVVLIVGTAGGVHIYQGGAGGASMMAAWMMWPMLFVIKVLMAIRASLFFAESRRSGALELLLSTPLSNAEIVRGQWLAMRRLFLWPIIAIVVSQLGLILLTFLSSDDMAAAFVLMFVAGGVGMYGLLKFVMDVLAIIWFGLWMGLSCRKPNRAALWTVAVAILLPMVAFCLPDIVIDLFIILWAKGKLEGDLRAHLARDPGMLRPPKDYNQNFGMV